MKRSTDCSIYLIFIRLASQLYYFELKNIYMAKYFYLDSVTNGFNSQNMIKISSSNRGYFATTHFLFNSDINKG